MFKIHKGLIFVLLATLIFANSNSVFAQETTTSVDVLNNLYVSNIIVDDVDFVQGDTMKGTFDLYNLNPQIVSGIKYRVELVQMIEDSFENVDQTGKVVDNAFDQISKSFGISAASESFNLKSGNTNIPFSYKIPNGIPEGRIGLVIQLYSSEDVKAGREYTEIFIEGSKVSYFLASGRISVYENEGSTPQIFGPIQGPLINKDEKANFEIFIQNDTKNDISVTPDIKIYRGNNSNSEMIFSNTFNSIVLGANVLNNSQIFSVPLDFGPGVYTAVFEYIDSSGAPRTHPIEFRYIIEGIKPKITEVLYNTKDFTKNNEFVVSFSYLDTPPSFRTNPDGSFKDPRMKAFLEKSKDFDTENIPNKIDESIKNLNISVLEGMNAEVLIYDAKTNSLLDKQKVNFEDSSSIQASFKSFMDVDELKITINLYQGDELVDTHIDNLKVTSNKYDGIFQKYWSKYQKIIVVLVTIFLISLILVVIKFANKNRNVMLSVLLSIIIIGSSYAYTKNVEARAGGTKRHYVIANVVVSSPKPPEVQAYMPGQTISFLADFQFQYCTNSGYQTRSRITSPVPLGSAPSGFGAWQGLQANQLLTQVDYKTLIYSSGINTPFVVPSQPGYYTFNYQIYTVSGDWWDIKDDSVTFRVGDDACLNIPGFQPEIPRGYVKIKRRNGLLSCLQKPDIGLKCTASKNRLEINETVTFNSTINAGFLAKFKWFKTGFDEGEVPSKQDDNVNSSTFTTSFRSPGLYLTTVAVTDTISNAEQYCKVGVAVGSAFENVELDAKLFEDLEFNYIDEDGVRYPFRLGDQDGKITFNLDSQLTNKKCKATWSASNVLKCALFNNNKKLKTIDFTGEEDLVPGSYQIRCIQSNDGTEIASETKICLGSPDFREI